MKYLSLLGGNGVAGRQGRSSWKICACLLIGLLTSGCASDLNSALIYAALNGQTDVAKHLIESGADVNAEDLGVTPIEWAAYKGNIDLIKLLIEKGANVNSKSNDQYTPLHSAAEGGKADAAKLLIEKGANINAKDINGLTPLHVAAANGHTDVAKLLVENSADINAKDNKQKTPLQYLSEKNGPEVADRLKSYAICYTRVNPTTEAAFPEEARKYREMPVKPALPEDVQQWRIMAEDAFNNKDFEKAIKYYRKGLAIEPLWPQGQFNAAMLAGELHCYNWAALYMKHYLELVPDAANAKAAREKMYLWKGKAKEEMQKATGAGE